MSVTGRPTECPECGSDEFEEIGRAEAGEITAYDLAAYKCEACGAEFENRPDPAAVNRMVFREESGAPEVYERCPATHDEFGQCFLDEGSPEHHGMHESELGEWKA